MVDEATDDAFGVLKGERGFRSDGVFFEDAVEALEFTVALRVVRRAEDVGGLSEADELFEVLGHELGAVVGDDARACFGMSFAGPFRMLLEGEYTAGRTIAPAVAAKKPATPAKSKSTREQL